MKELKSENAPTETLSKAIDEIHDINVEVNKFTAEQDGVKFMQNIALTLLNARKVDPL